MSTHRYAAIILASWWGSTILMSQWRPFSGQAGKLGFGERIFTS